MTHPTDALRLVPVPFNLLSESAGLLDCEGYGPISSQLNALLAGSGLPSRGDLHTALMDAIHGDLMRQNPSAFVEEDGNSTLAIPTSKAFLTVDVSSLAESALTAAPASPLPEGGGVPADVARLVVAARKVAFENPSQAELRELDIASEAFASRVPWDDAPDELPAAPTGAK